MSSNAILAAVIAALVVFAIVMVIMQLNTRKNINMLSRLIEKQQRESNDMQNARMSEHNGRMEELGVQFNRTMSEINRSLGSMNNLADDVDDLKRLMSNVKSRGIIGELQLGAILSDMLSPGQYEENVAVKGGSERVEYAVRFPGDGDRVVYLPIDSKFPGDAYLNLLDAYDIGDRTAVKECNDILKRAIIKAARDIKTKYVYPPLTTDFAIMFLPFEGLYAEVLRMNIMDSLQREFHVTVAGPTTLAAMLSSFQMGFRAFALQEKSSEVWETLERVKTEFDKFEAALEHVQGRINQTQNELETLVGARTRGIQRALKNIYEDAERES